MAPRLRESKFVRNVARSSGTVVVAILLGGWTASHSEMNMFRIVQSMLVCTYVFMYALYLYMYVVICVYTCVYKIQDD
jgi:hypothetical protein